MFKNLIIYRIDGDIVATAEALIDALESCPFVECGATQAQSVGWVPPRGIAHGALVESIGGHWIMKMQTEQRLLPSSVVKDRVEEIAEQIEEQTGRKPGKKAMKDLKEQATLELLPLAFTRRTSMLAWIDPAARLLAVDAPSDSRADDLVTMLIKSGSGKMNLHRYQTSETPAGCMAAWLMDGDSPAQLSIDREGEFKSSDEMKSTVRYQRHALDTDEIRQHLSAGKRPTKLALTFGDRVSFVLTDTLAIKRLAFLDVVFEGKKTVEKDERFDADVAIACGELAKLLPALFDALGGEFVLPVFAAAAGTDEPAGPAPHMPSDGPDPIYAEAIGIVQAHSKASISLVQRHLRIGYNRAARLLERMQIEGLVSAMSPAGHYTLLETTCQS